MIRKHGLFFIVVVLLIASITVTRGAKFAWSPTTQSYPTPTKIPTPTVTTLVNPASVNCSKVGGTLVMKRDGAGNTYGLCYFQDARACEEWALLHGDCPVGGVKTTGYDTLAQKYCAWLGGKTIAAQNAKCTFSNGSVCTDTALYNNTCHKK